MSHLRIANELKGQKLTPLEREVVIGCLLSDGTLSKSGKEYRLRIEHKAAHRGYVDWKYHQLQRVCVTPPKFISQHNSYRFGTVGHPELTGLHRVFYVNGVKSLPKRLGENFSSLGLAILFMDDGGRIHNTVSLALHSYSGADAELIRLILRGLGIESSWQSDGHGYGRRLYIATSSYAIFKRLVKPYVDQVPCMAYKLP
jgi:hypothetical protein